jgi:Ran GTPase-activating protein (RanGAP) involved in mRNA processing and transport
MSTQSSAADEPALTADEISADDEMAALLSSHCGRVPLINAITSLLSSGQVEESPPASARNASSPDAAHSGSSTPKVVANLRRLHFSNLQLSSYWYTDDHAFAETDKALCTMITALRSFRNLRSLGFADNCITLSSFKALADTLQSGCLARLESLDLRGCRGHVSNESSEADDSYSALAKCLRFVPSLKRLRVGHISITGTGLRAICNALTSLPRLSDLTLCGCPDRACHQQHALELKSNVAVLAGALRSLQLLTVLNLSGNGLGDEGIKLVAEVLPTLSLLTQLNLGFNNMTADGTHYLAEALVDLRNLTTLKLGAKDNLDWDSSRCNRIGDVGCEILSRAFPKLPVLEVIHLGCNQIGEIGIQALASALQHTMHLSELKLNLNMEVGIWGGTVLAAGLRFAPQLAELHLRGIALSDEGCMAIADSLQHVPLLQVLNLEDNDIGSEGAACLAAALAADAGPYLRGLLLGFNPIAEGAIKLAAALPNVPLLSALSVHDPEITCDEITALSKSLRHLPQLQSLTLGDYNVRNDDDSFMPLNTDAATALARMLVHLPYLKKHEFCSEHEESPVFELRIWHVLTSLWRWARSVDPDWDFMRRLVKHAARAAGVVVVRDTAAAQEAVAGDDDSSSTASGSSFSSDSAHSSSDGGEDDDQSSSSTSSNERGA